MPEQLEATAPGTPVTAEKSPEKRPDETAHGAPMQPEGGVKPETEERLFSQGDVDRIVQRRIAEERARSAAQLERQEQEHRTAIRRYEAESSLERRGLSAELLNVIAYADESAFEAALDRIEQLAQERAQRIVEERFARYAGTPSAGNPCAQTAATKVRTAMGLDR